MGAAISRRRGDRRRRRSSRGVSGDQAQQAGGTVPGGNNNGATLAQAQQLQLQLMASNVLRSAGVTLVGINGERLQLPQMPQAEMRRTCTIRNEVNLKKKTLRIVRDEGAPDTCRVAFTLDAACPCRVSVMFMAMESSAESDAPATRITPRDTSATSPPIRYEAGLGQSYIQQPLHGLKLSQHTEEELTYSGGNTYPVVVRLETEAREAAGTNGQNQTTFATFARNSDGDWVLNTLKQKIWIDSVTYELQEIYGIEQNGEQTELDGLDSGKECVICLAAPRDTTVLPCRHMCMCTDCARALSYQTNKCPICRCMVEQLLQIKSRRPDDEVSNMQNRSDAGSTAPATAGDGGLQPVLGSTESSRSKMPSIPEPGLDVKPT
eukprot:jgi/Chlat1/3977/Chrsp26S04041